jgi:hypothetical protein
MGGATFPKCEAGLGNARLFWAIKLCSIMQALTQRLLERENDDVFWINVHPAYN